MINPILSPEVLAAHRSGPPIVALESAIIAHGMPYPQNVELALMVEQDVRDAGAIPATVAVIDGCLHIGLVDSQIKALGKADGVAKLSRADLAVCLAQGRTGATTVAATMIAARQAGIEVLATGGIGGVHRGADRTFDISADLYELAQTQVTVVASGAKAILDLPKTLEVLETLGVPVIAFGQDSFPAFWSSASAIPAPLRMNDAREIAAAHRARATLGLPGGQLVANPVPLNAEIPAREIEPAINQALADMDHCRIVGKEVTPFLLQRILEQTGERSLTANSALIRNNARLAATIACALKNLPRPA